MLMEIVIALLVLWLGKRYWERRKFYAHLKNFQIIYGLPIIGAALEFISPKKAKKHLETFITEYKDGNVVINIFNQTILLIFEPKMAEIVLRSNEMIDKSYEYKFSKSLLGDGLVTNTGELWKKHRKLLTPSFHFANLLQYMNVFNAEGDILVRKLESKVGEKRFDVGKIITLYALDVIHESAMGTSIHAQEDPNSAIVQSMFQICDIIYRRSFSPIHRFDFTYQFTRCYNVEKESMALLANHTNDLVQKRKAHLIEELKNSADENDFGIKKRFTFLDILLEAQLNDNNIITDKEIKDEVDTFMFAGHETTSLAISMVLFELSNNQEVQEKLYQELLEVVGTDKNVKITYEHVQNLKYAEMIIKEGLRLYPSIPFYGRQLKQDVEYGDGKILPKGLSTFILPLLQHRQEYLFEKPLIFYPEHFSAEQIAKRHPYSYLPFSAGPRNCIGQKFAMLQMKTTLAKVCMNFKILPVTPAHAIDLVWKVSLQPSNGVLIQLMAR